MRTFSITGKPFGKQRPKFSRAGGFVKTYTPKETVNYENLVKLEYERQCGSLPPIPAGKPVAISITAEFQPPASASKKKREAMLNGDILPMVKPDADNIAKIICDALNGIAYTDDKQVTRITVRKIYSDFPKTWITISEDLYKVF